MRVSDSFFPNNKLFKQRETNKSKILSKLSSGQKINQSSDDAAGLSISEGMKAQIRGLDRASRNSQDAISMLQSSDGAMDEITSMLQRMRELSIQSSNDTLNEEDRYYSNLEFTQLKQEIDKISTNTEWNTKKLYENHEPVYQKISANKTLVPPVEVITGYNDKLSLNLDGNMTKEVNLKAGKYTINQFVDMMDDSLAPDEDIVISLTEDNRLTLSAEGYKEVLLSDGGSSFFYEYHLGHGPGTIFGTSDLSGRLPIINGSNNKFSFNVDGDKFEVVFPTSPVTSLGYTAEELVDIMQTSLDQQNSGVKVYIHNNNIALNAGHKTIDGFSGNMIKIDGITSILYDNAYYGKIEQTQGFIQGTVDLTQGANINDENNIIKFNLDGISQEIKLNNFSYTSSQELLDEIDKKLTENNINAKAEISVNNYGKVIKIESKSFGTTSKVEIDDTCNSFDTLFRRTDTRSTISLPKVITAESTRPIVMGHSSSFTSSIKVIEDVNDTLNFSVDGTEYNLKLERGIYNKSEILTKLNNYFSEKNINIEASSGDSSNISFVHKNKGLGNSIILDTNSSAFDTLFSYKTLTGPVVVRGTTIRNDPIEGTTTGGSIVQTKAYVQGNKDLSSGLIVDDYNDSLNFTMSGISISINLNHQAYSLNELISELNTKLNIYDMTVKSNSGKLYFETIKEGNDQIFNSFSGNAYQDLFQSVNYTKPSVTSSIGNEVYSNITGAVQLDSSSIEITNENNKLNFNFTHLDNSVSNINLIIPTDNYSASQLIENINTQLTEIGLNVDIKATLNNGHLVIKSTHLTPNSDMKNYSGSFYDNFLKKTTVNNIIYNPTKHVGTSNPINQHFAYTVGRKSLDNEIIINPKVNDTLSFNYTEDNIKKSIEITLDPGNYNSNSLIEEINKQLELNGVTEVQAQIGGVNTGTNVVDSDKLVLKSTKTSKGNYHIDGVSGSAAYSVFFNASSAPVPTYTVGVSDISAGVEIISGRNDEFIFNEDGVKRKLEFPAGKYTAEEFIDHINTQLNSMNSEVKASLFDGKLKLSFDAVGYRTLDNIRGNGREFIYGLEERDGIDLEHYHIGANKYDNLQIDKAQISIGKLRINTLQIETREGSDKSIKRLDNAIGKVSHERSKIGAFSNRLEHIVKINDSTSENLQKSESNIRDLDMAKAMVELSRENILSDVLINMKSQMNKNAEGVLQLLK